MSKFNRRELLKTAAGSAAYVSAASIIAGTPREAAGQASRKNASVMGLVVPELDIVRVGFIGVGRRGSGHVRRFCYIDGVEIVSICDTDKASLEQSLDTVVQKGRRRPSAHTGSDYAYRDLLDRNDIDIVIISTPWKWHAPMCVETMESGKHAFVEVPAATSIEECWQLVDTAERHQKNCMMLENVNYGRNELMVLNMVRQGLFGELVHAEAAYIHELRWQMKDLDRGTGSWRTYWHTKRNGNLYPTHGLGPVAQYMNVNRGDRFVRLSSFSSKAAGRAAYARREFPPSHERNKLKYIAGDMNTSILRTFKGRTIMIQHDTTTPRPYTRHNLIQGTNGAIAGFPNRIALEKVPPAIQAIYDREYAEKLDEWEEGERRPRPQSFHRWDYNMEKWYKHYDHPLWIRMGKEAKKTGGHGGMDFLMSWRLIHCLRNAEPLDQDVYDATAWSSVCPLSVDSVKDNGNSRAVPDFSRGAWKTGKPLGIVS